MSLWLVLTRVIGSRRCAMLLSFHCNRKGPSISMVVRATQPPQPRPFLHFIVTCNARRQALFHRGLFQSAATNPSPKNPTLPSANPSTPFAGPPPGPHCPFDSSCFHITRPFSTNQNQGKLCQPMRELRVTSQSSSKYLYSHIQVRRLELSLQIVQNLGSK